MRYIKSRTGFTTIEFMMVIIVAGFLMVPVYGMIMNTIKLGPNEDRMDNIRYAIAEHFRVFGTLPCPADIDAAPGDTYYDTGVDDSGGACQAGTLADGVYFGALPVKELAGVMDCLGGQRYDPTSTDPPDPGSQAEYISNLPLDLRGALQKNILRINAIRRSQASGEDVVKNLALNKGGCIRQDMMLDEYGNKFLYAVSENMTVLSEDDPLYNQVGTIQLETDQGTALAENGLWFILVSMGKDGKGAYDKNGDLVQSCTTGELDSENCDNDDAIFVSAPFSTVEGTGYFDDFVDFSLDRELQEHEVWYWTKESGSALGDPYDMRIPAERRLIITHDKPTNLAPGDKLYIEGGDLRIRSSGAGGSLNVSGGIAANQNVTAGTNITVESTAGARAPKFCYDDPAAPADMGCR